MAIVTNTANPAGGLDYTDRGFITLNALDPKDAVNVYLEDDADPDMNVNGAITPATYKYTVPFKTILVAYRILVYYDDATAFAAEKFGALTVLTNGVQINAGGVLLDTWKDNMDLATTMHDVPGNENFAKADKSLAGRWTFRRSFGSSLKLFAGETIEAVVNDDLTGLTQFRMKMQGCLIHLK